MSQPNLDRLRSIKTLPSLVAYLRDELDWPVDQSAVEDDVTYDYAAEELGFAADTAVHIKEIKQLRPLDSRQPWGVFWVNFEKKRLPVVMLRRILGNLVLKKRAKSQQRTWHMHDLLFISAYGEESDRSITFAHFSQPPDSPGDLPVLKVLGWDDDDTILHLFEAHSTLAEKLRWPSTTTSLGEWRTQWTSAFTLRHREVITTTNELVEELARLADATRRRARTILARESESGPLRRLYAAFKAALIHDLTEDDFADVIAQTISYGLLIARFSRAAISAQNLVDMVPATNPFLRELLATFLALAGRQSAFDFDELGIQDVVEVLNRSNADAVKADFGNRTRDEDPVIHFYEHFLAAYDRKKKIQRGVFYTPQPAVSYIVRSVHELLQQEFGLEDGLASTITWGDMLKKHPDLKLPTILVPKADKAEGEEKNLPPDEFFVLILDIATGTGTFLVETIEVIFQHLQAKWAKHGLQGMPVMPAQKRSPSLPSLQSHASPDGRDDRAESGRSTLHHRTFTSYWNEYVPAALLPRLYGYELMMAPYTIAHMKLALKFSEINARLGQPDYLFQFEGRAHIYLTNTLEPASGFQTQEFSEFFPALAHEGAAVNTIKRTKRFTVVIGNPPYSLLSANLEPHHRALVENYKFVNGERIRERGALQLEKNLNDDYVKFLRLSQLTIESAGIGVSGLITNHSFLDNPTMRGVRWSIMQSTSRIWVNDLHGNSTKQEQTPNGGEDKNIFQIKQGVAITLGVRLPGARGACEAKHHECWGPRQSKEAWLATNHACKHSWGPLHPTHAHYLFVPQSSSLKSEYEVWPSLPDAMPANGAGYVTARDNLVIDFDRDALVARIRAFDASRLSDDALLKAFEVADKKGWDAHRARKELKHVDIPKRVITTNYRPFDARWIFFDSTLVWGRSWPTMKHVLGASRNMTILATRMTKDQWDVWVARTVSSHKAMSAYDTNSVFPLFLAEDSESSQRTLASEHRINFANPFLKSLANALKLKQTGTLGLPTGLTPEDIFHYIYAVFHSPGYRSRYAEFLKIDFPRLPLTGNLELFRVLARLGGELTALHLLEAPQLATVAAVYDRRANGWRFEGGGEASGKTSDGHRPPLQLKFIGGEAALVSKPGWSAGTVWLDSGGKKAETTAGTTGFRGVPEAVWNFHIGGYQVCQKWLKDRKGRTLTKDDLAHYHKIVIALSETIRLMAEIDEVIETAGGWPGAFATPAPI